MMTRNSPDPAIAPAENSLPDRRTGTASSQHFLMLDGLRGIAAIAVLAIHLKVKFVLGYQPQAGLAVDFFFLLSGFVIAHAYWQRLVERRMSLRAFIVARLTRLYPMILLGNVIGAIYFLVLGDKTVTQVAGAMVFALALVPLPRLSDPSQSAFPLNGAFWSLTYELSSNIILAALAPYLMQGWRLIAFLIASIVALTVVAAVGMIDASIPWAEQGYAFFRALAPFVLGIVIYRFLPSPRPVSAGSTLLGLALAAILGAVVFAPILSNWVHLFFILLLFPAIVLIASALPDGGPLCKVWRWLGAASYPVYALHVPFAIALDPWLTPLLARHAWYGAPLFALVVGALLLLATLALHLYDAPVRRWLKQALARRAAARAVPSSS